jgi:hypothetical protein
MNGLRHESVSSQEGRQIAPFANQFVHVTVTAIDVCCDLIL